MIIIQSIFTWRCRARMYVWNNVLYIVIYFTNNERTFVVQITLHNRSPSLNYIKFWICKFTSTFITKNSLKLTRKYIPKKLARNVNLVPFDVQNLFLNIPTSETVVFDQLDCKLYRIYNQLKSILRFVSFQFHESSSRKTVSIYKFIKDLYKGLSY